jgi:hypothetical protein
MEEFGPDNVMVDYGENARETSRHVIDTIYKNGDTFALIENRPKVIFGHVPAKKYINLSRYKNIITFVRDPIERVVSEYKHVIRHEKYSGTLSNFANMPRNKNTMHQYLSGVSWVALGYIGLSSRYDESVEMMNAIYGLNLYSKKLNLSPKLQKIKISQEDREELEKLNQLDISLYAQAAENFNWRRTLFNESKPFVHGAWRINRDKKTITGFAFYAENEDAVTILIKDSLDTKIKVIANKYHSAIHKHGGARCGYVGFSLEAKTIDLDNVQCLVSSTGQPIPFLGQ